METSGTLCATGIRRLIADGAIASDAGVADDQIQPASLDLSISSEVFRMPGSVLALEDERVRDLIDALALERLSLSAPTCLARNQVYLVRLRERFALPPGIEAYTNSKSSTGRVDLATRVLTDSSTRYDRIGAGYAGELWLELIPRAFDVILRSGVSLNQAIFFRDREQFDAAALVANWEREPLLYAPDGAPMPAASSVRDSRVVMTADLSRPVVGYMAKRTHLPLDLCGSARHEPDDFFAPVASPPSGYLFLEKDRFYILATWERVRVPADTACEMVPYDPTAGEFRAHYAGFFDPGWGMGGPVPGTRAVLEIRPHEDDLILRHRQPICGMAYERLAEACPVAELYGGRGNNYATQSGPRLSKHFRER
ncbi:MAG: 2'-deoxycytidine 5'-triphosphate deaminase [Planctomycetota bacterium]